MSPVPPLITVKTDSPKSAFDQVVFVNEEGVVMTNAVGKSQDVAETSILVVNRRYHSLTRAGRDSLMSAIGI
jgi:hypothetical protein